MLRYHMNFLRTFARSLGGFFLGLAVFFIVIELIFLISGQGLGQALGLSWYKLNSGGLNLFQVVIQRFTFPGIWDYIVVPLLKMPAWKSLNALAILFFVMGSLLRRIPVRKKFFR